MKHMSGQRTIRTDEWKLLDDQWTNHRCRGLKLYNVKEDPMEVINLAEKEKDKAQELRETLQSWVRANLKEGEPDPVFYEDEKDLGRRGLDYGQRVKQLLEALKENQVGLWRPSLV